MRIKCAACGKRYRIKDSLISPAGVRVRCPNCNREIPVYPESTTEKTGGSSSSTESTAPINSSSSTQAVGDDSLPNPIEAIEEEITPALIQSNPIGYDMPSGEEISSYEATHIQTDDDEKTTAAGQDLAKRAKNAARPGSEEISMPGEISQISFESDASFLRNQDDPKAAMAPPPKPPANLPQTILNPRPPLRSDSSSSSPTKIAPLQRAADRGASRRFSWQWLLVCIAAALLFWTFWGKQLWHNRYKPAPAPQTSPTPQPIAAVATAGFWESATASRLRLYVDFATRAAFEQALVLAKQTPDSDDAQAYVLALHWLLFDDLEARNRGLQAVSASMVKSDGDKPYTIAAAALMANQETPGVVITALDKALPKLREAFPANHPDHALLIFMEVWSLYQRGQSNEAQTLLKNGWNQHASYGPLTALAVKLRLDGNLQPSASTLLNARRESLAAAYPELQALQATPAPTPTATPATTARNKPTPRARPTARPTISKPTVKPTQPSGGAATNDELLRRFLKQGDLHFQQEQYSDAMNQYKLAQKYAAPRDATALIRMGFAWLKLYRFDEAYSHFNRAVALDANQADTHKGLGMVYDQLGDSEKAAREFSLYLQLKPNAQDAGEIRETLRKLRP